MFATLLTLALFFAPAVLASLSIDTPEFTQCSPAKIAWSGSDASAYNLIVVPANDVCGDAIADLGDHSGPSITWNVTLPAGLEVVLSLEDSTGDEAWSGTITVKPSTDSSCVPASLLSEVASSAAKSSSAASKSAASTEVSTSATLDTDSSPTVPVGAAGSDPTPSSSSPVSGSLSGGTNGAYQTRQIGTPVMVLSAIVAIVALSL